MNRLYHQYCLGALGDGGGGGGGALYREGTTDFWDLS